MYTYVVVYLLYVGIALIGGDNPIISANAISDYSYVNARGGVDIRIARCVTGLDPSATDNNSALGGVYFNGRRIPFTSCGENGAAIIQPRPASNLNNLGVINIAQCRALTTTAEGIYTCTMMNSSMMNESVRFGVYFIGRSESLDLRM